MNVNFASKNLTAKACLFVNLAILSFVMNVKIKVSCAAKLKKKRVAKELMKIITPKQKILNMVKKKLHYKILNGTTVFYTPMSWTQENFMKTKKHNKTYLLRWKKNISMILPAANKKNFKISMLSLASGINKKIKTIWSALHNSKL